MSPICQQINCHKNKPFLNNEILIFVYYYSFNLGYFYRCKHSMVQLKVICSRRAGPEIIGLSLHTNELKCSALDYSATAPSTAMFFLNMGQPDLFLCIFGHKAFTDTESTH